MSKEREQVRAYAARREAILDRVRTILVEQLHVRLRPEDIDPDVSLFGTGLGLDSVDAVELVLCIETEFGVKISSQITVKGAMRTVNSVAGWVLDQGGTEP